MADSLPALLRRLLAERYPLGTPERGAHLTAAADGLRLPARHEWRISAASLSRWTTGAATPSFNGLLDLLDALQAASPVTKSEREVAIRLLVDARKAPPVRSGL